MTTPDLIRDWQSRRPFGLLAAAPIPTLSEYLSFESSGGDAPWLPLSAPSSRFLLQAGHEGQAVLAAAPRREESPTPFNRLPLVHAIIGPPPVPIKSKLQMCSEEQVAKRDERFAWLLLGVVVLVVAGCVFRDQLASWIADRLGF